MTAKYTVLAIVYRFKNTKTYKLFGKVIYFLLQLK